METTRFLLHYGMHFLAPLFIAAVFFRKDLLNAYFKMLVTMLMDADHLLASPIYDPSRCSVGFHLLHSFPFIWLYVAMLFFPRLSVWGTGLCFHIFTDYVDCLGMPG